MIYILVFGFYNMYQHILPIIVYLMYNNCCTEKGTENVFIDEYD